LIHPEDWSAWCDALEAHVRGESEFFEAEPRLRLQDGHWIWMQVRGRIVRRAGQPSSQRITGTYVDVTQRHEIDAARQELQQRLAKLLVQVPGTVYQFRLRPDGSSCFPYASPGIADIYGITAFWLAGQAKPEREAGVLQQRLAAVLFRILLRPKKSRRSALTAVIQDRRAEPLLRA
jgi:PAS domain-containing protein